MLRTPDGHGRIELAMFHTPKAISAEPKDAPANTLGIRRIMFVVDDIEDVRWDEASGCVPANPEAFARRGARGHTAGHGQV
jgi:hypothetical protein